MKLLKISEMVNKTRWPLARAIKKKLKRNQLPIQEWKGDITNHTDIMKQIRGRCEQLYSSTLDNLEEMDKFLKRHKSQKRN